jgi:hypothetical protein
VRRAHVALATLVSWPAGVAFAHQPDDPDAHRSMPNQVTAGVIALCPSSYVLEAGDSAASAEGVACIGAQLSFSREIGRFFELRLRTAYERPFLFDKVSNELGSLHDIRATLGASAVFYRLSDDLTVTIGPELGLAAFVRETPDGSRPHWGVAWGGVFGIRPWLTYHTGLFAEAAFGGASTWHDDSTLRSVTLGRVTLGWADRF